jgi:hypothetical protein
MAVKRWNGTAWVVQSGNANAVKYQATAPVNPVAGDIWVKSDVDTPTVNTSVFYRWRKTMTGGETSLSGLDDNSLSLSYTPSYEQLFINGVLQVRNVDYTPASSTSVTGLTALVAGDVVEIMSPNVYSVSNVYTQATSDAKYATIARSGQFIVVPTSVDVGSGSFALSSNGQLTFTGASSVSLNGCFTSTYDSYQIILSCRNGSANDTGLTMQFRNAGATIGGTAYFKNQIQSYGTTVAATASNSTSNWNFGVCSQTWFNQTTATISNPASAKSKSMQFQCSHPQAAFTALDTYTGYGFNSTATAYDGLTITVASGTINGTIRVYGYNNGA